jgi:hypothetical protein
MNSRFTVVEASLNRAEFRWKWFKFLRYSFLFGSIVSALVLLFGVAMIRGWVANETAAVAFFVALAILGLLAWALIGIVVLVKTTKREWLAGALERGDRRLMDRLHTLLFLERNRGSAQTESFTLRIARQTQAVVEEKPPPPAFPATATTRYFLVFLGLMALTVLIYQAYSPWARMLAAQQARYQAPGTPDKPLELDAPATNNVEQQQAWGEVRITDPGGDLKVTKVDVVPLQIEAAANQGLKTVSWYSAVNGAGETTHELAPPTEPRYAVYQPTVYLDELRLADWDVMTYYAKANTERSNTFASEVYFVEVRPFREDIMKMPGGEGGKAYEALSEMTSLIGQQQHVIRETHQHVQRPQAEESLQKQDRTKLSEAEGDLGESAQHLYAKMASEMENKPIGEALDNLAQAQKSLESASKLLSDNSMNDATSRERTALAQLIAARKVFQKAVSDNPKAFEDPENKDEEPTPVADASRKLSEMAEFRNEAKASQEFVEKTLDQQRALEHKAASAPRSEMSKLADDEKKLQQALDEFQQQHPQVFTNTQSEAQQAQQAMTKAASELGQKSSEARSSVRDATQQLSKLSDAMKSRTAGQELANAYKLKQMLDKQAHTMDQASQGAGNVSDQALRQSADETRETVNQLKKAAEQEPTRDAFGRQLRDALNGENKVDLDAKLAELQQASDEESRKQKAGEARDALNKISKAFEASQPDALQVARQKDPLKPDGRERLDQGMAELESLIKQQENSKQLKPQDQDREEQEALGNLRGAMAELYGEKDEPSQRIIVQLEDALKKEKPIDIELLKKLMTELQHYSVETSDKLARKDEKPEVTNIDPTRLPPAYRGRIQKYFEKLSEK